MLKHMASDLNSVESCDNFEFILRRRGQGFMFDKGSGVADGQWKEAVQQTYTQ